MNAELKRRFNTVVFIGGPLDGVCWPCKTKPTLIEVTIDDDYVYSYGLENIEEYGDDTFQYTMECLNAGTDEEDYRKITKHYSKFKK